MEKYLWSGRTTLLAVYDGSDKLLQRFAYADDRMPVAMTAGGAVYYLAYDQVGSLRQVTGSSGNIVKRIEYDSFGNILSDSNPSLTIPFGFAGGLQDRDTNLVRFGYRDYLSEIGKWTAMDPIDFAGGDSNLYGYVAGDPVNGIDPWGLKVTNNSPSTIYYVKPENSGSAVPVAPNGGTFDGPVDGITAPNGSGGQYVIKTRGTFGRGDITIDDSGYNLSGPDLVNHLIGGGKKDQSWLEGRHNQVPTDTGWDDLFGKCKQ